MQTNWYLKKKTTNTFKRNTRVHKRQLNNTQCTHIHANALCQQYSNRTHFIYKIYLFSSLIDLPQVEHFISFSLFSPNERIQTNYLICFYFIVFFSFHFFLFCFNFIYLKHFVLWNISRKKDKNRVKSVKYVKSIKRKEIENKIRQRQYRVSIWQFSLGFFKFFNSFFCLRVLRSFFVYGIY